MTTYRLVGSISLLILAATGRHAQGQTIQRGSGGGVTLRIVGRLRDFQKVPIAQATIGLAPWNMTVWRPFTRTDTVGEFDFNVKLQPGNYCVIAAFGSFQVASKCLDVKPSMKPAVGVIMEVPKDEARSDAPPRRTPDTGLLPEGSFPEPEFPLTANRGAPTVSDAAPLPAESPKLGNREIVSVFYVTNRVPIVSRPGYYTDGPLGQTNASYGVCKVSIPPTHQPGRLERPSIWRFERTEDVKQDIVITSRELMAGEAAFQGKLHQAFEESRSEAFLFIHGYNVSFDDAVHRTAQMFRDLQFNGVPILFSWPAQNAWWRYPAAEDVVDASARQLQEFILHTLVNQHLTAVNVVAHSMGNRILMATLERLSLLGTNARFNNIVMAAPDINIADFNALSGILQSAAKRTTVYSSSHDLALLASKAFHSYSRLGEAPPTQLVRGIDTVDASAIRRDLLGHSYFGDSATIMRDLFLLIKENLDPQARYLQPRTLANLQYWIISQE